MAIVTNQPYDLLIRADAGGALGTGHVMRMIALAQAWQDRGGNAIIATSNCPSVIVERIKNERIGYFSLHLDMLGGDLDLADTTVLARNIGIKYIALDGYHFKNNYQATLKQEGYNVLVVDDYGHCKNWDANLVLNQNIRMKLPPKREGFLNGPEFALLRREFRQASLARQKNELSDKLHILITFGGVDPSGSAIRVLRALRAVVNANLTLTVLAGPASKHFDELQREISNSPHSCKLLVNINDMPRLYSSVDRVISAGGSSCYEWMRMGIPGWVTSIAKNQDEIVKAMIARRYAAGIEKIDCESVATITDSLKAWISESNPPKKNSGIDGYGACKVAAIFSGDKCWLRPLDIKADMKFLYDLANDEIVRKAGCHPSKIPWKDHVSWISKQCTSIDSQLYTIQSITSGPIGQIRFHRQNIADWEVGISIHRSARNLGIGARALSIAMHQLISTHEVRSWLARIRSENVASQRLFAKLGFTLKNNSGGMQIWHSENLNQNLK